jgi:7-cyano-7-deazaguanine reductase
MPNNTTPSDNQPAPPLKLLGGNSKYPTQYSPEILEVFDNAHPNRDYFVKFIAPEFTSLCPITHQPDFAKIIIRYNPDRYIVESKSLK